MSKSAKPQAVRNAEGVTQANNAKLIGRLKDHWNPQPIQAPEVDPELQNLTGLPRGTEALRYALLKTEHWLSPNGKLREWVNINGKIGSVLLMPALLVVPLITFILWQVAKWMTFAIGISGKLIILPLAVFLAAVAISAVVIVAKAIFGRR